MALMGPTVVGQLLQHDDATDVPSHTEWVVDSGASNHTTPDPGNISLFRAPNPVVPSSILVGNGSVLPITSVGDTVLLDPFYLNNVLVTLNIIKNLLFVR
jgi:hypothetical protein